MIGTNPHDADAAPEAPDRTVRSIGLPRHPSLDRIMDDAHQLEELVNRYGQQAITAASTLAANGYPASTLGDGGSRGTDDTSSTERLALNDKDQFKNADRRLATLLSLKSQTDRALLSMIPDLVHHAQDLDPIPVGTGECQACGRFCRPTASRPGFRLRSGMCPSCYGAYRNEGRPEDRSGWIRARRNRLTDANGIVHQEDLGGMDLTSETLTIPTSPTTSP